MLRAIIPLFAVVFMLTATAVQDEAPPPERAPESAVDEAGGSVVDELGQAVRWSRSVNARVFAVASRIVDDDPADAGRPVTLAGLGVGLARFGAGWARVMDWMRGGPTAFVGPGDAVADLGVVPLSDR